MKQSRKTTQALLWIHERSQYWSY